ncbi:hypothetical protein Tco_0001987 [Tanacetum coccineum]
METKDTLSSCSNSEDQQMQQIQDKAKESCMVSFRQLHSHLKLLSNNDLKGTRTESGFKRAFHTLSQDQRLSQAQRERYDMCNALDAVWFDIGSMGQNQKDKIQAAIREMMHMQMNADIRPIYDEEPSLSTNDCSNQMSFATGQTAYGAPEFNNEGESFNRMLNNVMTHVLCLLN